MNLAPRVRTIYVKELLDILRDHRTLIAMIVVPILLYPLLMLGSIQAVSFQAESMAREEVRIGVLSEAQGRTLLHVLQSDSAALGQQRAGQPDAGPAPPPGGEAAASAEPLENVKVLHFESRETIERRIADRTIQLGFILHDGDPDLSARDRSSYRSIPLFDDPHEVKRIELLVDEEDVRSAYARRRLQQVLERTRERTVAQRVAHVGLPPAFDKPFEVTTTDLSSPPSILGQVLPLILILMTITGAIYPAIDLTAGERERGTLESLMVSPVPVLDLVVGKFLVVTTVAILGAALNLASVTATVYFGGFQKVIATPGDGLPLGTMLVILVCLVPFAVMMSAVMIAVCSFARTFKEAQNYVTPVILAVLVPGGIAALPATRLEGIMLVMPVGNMVLLARDLLLGAAVSVPAVALVLLSTTLYAGASVAVAASVFGREAVVFSDAASLRTLLSRQTLRRSSAPSPTTGLLIVALLFPVWFFVQSANAPGPEGNAAGMLFTLGWAMPLLFVLLPVLVLWYGRIDLRSTFALRLPTFRYGAAAVLLGLSAWVPAHELSVLQHRWTGVPAGIIESAEVLRRTVAALPFSTVLVLLAVLPAVCEELLFRGLLLSSVGRTGRKWTAIVVTALVFGVFHFFWYKFLVTAALGLLLAYVCWNSRSIFAPMIVHFTHNTAGLLAIAYPEPLLRLGLREGQASLHLPLQILAIGGAVFLAGLLIISVSAPQQAPRRAALPGKTSLTTR